ncbi:MAG: peptide ABC transporter substrate-binding protein [Bacilli bacterium]|nr:peptide ABC transporter substrate-binding protein [Bacilli bacterium]
MKKLLLVLVSFVLVLGLGACKKANEDIVFNWNIGADPATLDPSLNGASDGGDVINQTFEGLVREINGVVQPGIAESWEVSGDGRTVTFHLRESNWSDGTPLTADDFVYAWKRGMDPATASEYSWIWEYTNVVGANDAVYNGGSLDDVGITAIDDYTFEVQLINPTAYFVSLMAFYHFMPVKQSAVEAAGGEDGLWAKDPELVVSNGPFVLTEYNIGEGLVLERNPEYWNADVVGIDVIQGKFIDDESTAYAAYNAGDLDFIPSVPSAEVPILIAESDEFYVFPLLGTYYYSFNMDKDGDGVNEGYDQDGLFSNATLRTALSMSIDREAICEAAGAGQVPAAGFVPPGFLDNEGNDFFLTAGTYGVAADDSAYAAAVTLFAQAASELGMTVAALQAELETQELLYNTSEGHQMIAEMVQEMWASNLGFTMPLANQEWAVFQDTRSAGDFEIARGGWLTDYMDPSGLLSIFGSTNSYNDPNYYNAAFDTLLAESQATTDAAVHFDKLYAAQEMFIGDMPIIPIYHYTDTMLVKDYVEGWARSVLGSVDFSQATINK